jgi:zinc protease
LSLTNTQSAFAIAGVNTAPAPSKKHESKFPTPQETKLNNGLRVIVVSRPALPLLSAEVLIGQGAAADPAGLAGTATMTGELLTKGTESMSAPEIAQTIESLGGSIGSGAGRETSAANIQVMSRNAEPALKILADVVLHPTFKPEEIDRLRNQRLDYLRVALQQPGSLARFVTERAVFGSGAFGHAVNGTLETLPKIKRDEITAMYQKYYRPGNAAFILAGDVTLAQAKTYAESLFGGWKNSGPSPNDNIISGSATWKPENLVIDMPEAGQAVVTLAKPAIKRDSPDYYTALVSNAALGNGFVSRLNREIRIKRGLSYGAGSSLEARRQPGLFSATAQTKNESAAEVAQLMKAELEQLVGDPVKGAELEGRKAVLTGRYARNLETNEGFVAGITGLVAYDLPLDTLNKYIPSIDAVTSEAVTDFAKKNLATATSLIIVGKATAFLDALKKNASDVRVIEQKNLDLNHPDLTK